MCKCETGDLLLTKLKMQKVYQNNQRSTFRCLLHIIEKRVLFQYYKITEIAGSFVLFHSYFFLIKEFT